MAAGPTYEPIATTTISSATTAFTMSSIPSTYTDIRIVSSAYVLSGTAPLVITFNSDTAANYSYNFANTSRSTATSSRSLSTSSIELSSYNSPGDTTPIIATMDLFNYASAVNKTVYFQYGADAGTYGSFRYGMGTWRSTSAITSITFTASTGTGFEAGSTITIYGIKAA